MTTTLTFNQFKSTAIYGTFSNVDSSNGSILADGKFKRNLTIEGNLILGKQTILDANGNPVNSESTIQFTLDNVLYNIPLRTLSFIKNVTSDVQQQLTNISNGSSFSNITVSGLINGIKINNYSNDNTSFSSGNTDIFGNNNTRFGYFTGSLLGYSNAVFGDQSLQNCTGHSNTAIGHNSQNGNTSYNYNTSVGSNSNIIGGSSNIAIGHVAQCSNCSNSIVIGNSITSTTNNEILLGSSVHTTQIPGNLSCNGLLSANGLNTSGNLSCNGLLSANVLNTSGDLSCNGLLSANRLSATGNITFTESINNITATVFNYLSGLTSNIQEQIETINLTINTYLPNYVRFERDELKNQIAPPGSIITYAGTASSLEGYFLCDGSSYWSELYPGLFAAIGYTYGYGSESGYFKVPNYKGIFLRGAGQQNVQLEVIGGNVYKSYQSPVLGYTVRDKSTQFTTSEFVDNINTEVRSVVTGSQALGNIFQSTNAISSLNFTKNNNTFNFGNEENYPVHTSVQYFIKY